jgi:uncharacterized protein (DUF1800 family)
MIHPHQLVARAGIRASAEDKARIDTDQWSGWVEWQLSLPIEDSSSVRDALSAATLKIEYGEGDGHGALAEERTLGTLSKKISDLWHLSNWEKKTAWEERVRPANETLAAVRLRAVLSEAQLQEAVVDFWRDHFAVNHDASVEVAIGLPFYEQDVLRRHAFGNFREFLEAVATSTSMLAYLDNASSRASPANENYARELFELHSIGADAYLNALYDKWREVPGALDGRPEGYIDQDVYEAARAFTGWTFASGQYIAEGSNLPQTGEFTYVDAWHDPYQKRVLAQEFEPYQAAMADGRRVLDMAAFHPATAQYVCKRLCQRFVADQLSPELIKSAAQVFTDNAKAPDQLAQVIRHILLSRDFAEATPRLQRPLFLFASMQRAAGVILPPSPDHTWMLDGMGQKVYMWHSPAGHPLRSGYWQSPGLLVRRWRMINETWQLIMAVDRSKSWANAEDFAREWASHHALDEAQAKRAATILRKSFGDEDRAITFSEEDRWITAQALSFLTSTPDFQAV